MSSSSSSLSPIGLNRDRPIGLDRNSRHNGHLPLLLAGANSYYGQLNSQLASVWSSAASESATALSSMPSKQWPQDLNNALSLLPFLRPGAQTSSALNAWTAAAAAYASLMPGSQPMTATQMDRINSSFINAKRADDNTGAAGPLNLKNCKLI
ncbi:unnamed protein product [Medioppia subpectinata]|uniref:Uncharacterized protein n=1 Tax=Medioppia subpectinata TaxID=1979941 RepID=A0A7R9Q130_9ACAR|nr:unnamed protein product [Medioppia subpectinata]CAG2108772.1 unnamed protein product [Medioppia subpectinata]